MRKDITIILIGVSLVGLSVGYWAAATYLPEWSGAEPVASQIEVRPAQETQAASESLLPGRIGLQFSQEAAAVGDETVVQILLDTGGRTISGFDLFLEFDPEAWVALAPQVTVSEREAFVAYPVNEVAPQGGTVRLSGLTDLDTGFTGEITVGSFLLSPQKPGKLGVTVVFEGVGVGTDTNLAERGTGQDILGRVENGILEVE
ncbi:MAG: hypothetical protein ACD_52C00084G0001 [uncultured bacterium]|nr:MAG: hypothetical protein ACD_52C00084G0001 [uncultured bacterium]